ncbi:substrate-binding domain-containing protein [bacterium]|nr:substrate-binding domain-containing protein [bacterium]
MRDAILPAFRKLWQRDHDEKVEFVTTYAGSGDVTDQIIKKYPAQIAIVSSELDAYQLPTRWRSWTELPRGGILASTPMIIVVREGNPKQINDFEDLTRPGIQIVHGDPVTSGGANLAILAEYESARRRTGEPDRGFEQLLGIWRNVTVRVPSAREARIRFEKGAGDVLITYEHDIIGNPSAKHIRGEIVYPRCTLLAQPIVVKIDNNIERWEHPLVDAFVQFLWSREAQQILVDYGFRSQDAQLNASNRQLGAIPAPVTLASLGKPVEVRRDILEGLWRNRILPQLPRQANP